jgi:cell division protease FtsH
MMKHIIRIVILTVIGMAIFNFFNRSAPHYDQNYSVSYSDFITDIRNNAVSEVVIDGNNVEGRRQNGERFTTYNPNDSRMIDELLEYGVKIKVERPQAPSTLTQILISWAPMLLLIAVTIYFMRKQQSMGGNN